MAENPLFTKGVLSVLNAIEYRNEITDAVTPDHRTPISTIIYLWAEDINKSGLTIEDFDNALRHIAHTEPSIKIIDKFDYTNDSASEEEAITGLEPHFAKISLLPNFEEKIKALRKKYSDEEKIPSSNRKVGRPKKELRTYAGDLKIEFEVNGLQVLNDGSISYEGKVLDMRNQIKDLCRLFMKNAGNLVTTDDIKDSLFASNKRDMISKDTVSKYVSELRGILKDHLGQDVISNQKEEGWYFDFS